MSITLEKIDLLRERAHVSYQDAKEALERCNNDIVEALVYLEQDHKVKPEKKASCESKFFSKVKTVVQKGNETKLVIAGKKDNLINIPLTAAILITIVATPVVIVGVPVALLTNHKIRIEKKDGQDVEVNEILDKMSSAVSSVKEKFTSEDHPVEEKH
ncbi:DUF4342 domain-containing protein [Geosporobacter ferrireducens]|uniref:DUF4342 domain-containing protein n=1 Tax=Geosporobacter ferrireducens TaxID=1424294 RepID=A0A1D8GIQ4_9FIRM|nr:DUF4342 domain-containing protein [Geosporobacter ferrireducens]AOT70803.1 hypothetical protein Gferi_15310 [Geosporobacter ferrireducens]MTI53500.1 DUF4342 domain-containing protein [Geosporobacter ferrireducens]